MESKRAMLQVGISGGWTWKSFKQNIYFFINHFQGHSLLMASVRGPCKLAMRGSTICIES